MLEYRINEFINTQKGNIAVVVKNLKTHEEININENLIFPAASMIKLAIMAALLQKAHEGEINLAESMKITEAVKTSGDGILKELNPGHGFSLEEIMTLMIIVSDNTAANLLIDLLGMEYINTTIRKLGLTDTTLQRRMMDFQAAREGRENLTTAKDLALLLELIYHGGVVHKEYSEMMLNIMKRQQIKGRLDLYLSEEAVIAHKAGDLSNLEHDAGIVYLDNREYIICILTNETASNRDGREIIGKIARMVWEEELWI